LACEIFSELGEVLLINRLDRLVFARHGPHLELDWIARQCKDVNLKACSIQMKDRQEHFDGMISGGKHFAILHYDVAFIGRQHENTRLVVSCVLAGIVGAVKVCLGGSVLGQRKGRGEPGVLLGHIRRRGIAQLFAHGGVLLD
jgi:hypothetical protein